LERELGIRGAVKLASNENPLGPSPKALAALDEGKETVHLYPDGGAHDLTRALADRWKVSGNHVVVGNGSDEIISLLVKTFVSPGEEAVMADHTFVMYKLAVTGGHGVCVEVPLKDWRHDPGNGAGRDRSHAGGVRLQSQQSHGHHGDPR
jgi:histidinol-phosphate aminotransferase